MAKRTTLFFNLRWRFLEHFSKAVTRCEPFCQMHLAEAWILLGLKRSEAAWALMCVGFEFLHRGVSRKHIFQTMCRIVFLLCSRRNETPGSIVSVLHERGSPRRCETGRFQHRQVEHCSTSFITEAWIC